MNTWNDPLASALPAAEPPAIYVVDDTEGLTELYTLFLRDTGYRVRAFQSRAEALIALMADCRKPELLITDYLGDAMPVDQFIERCLAVHPSLRILMASGLSPKDARSSRANPDRFIQKPFSIEEFLREVSAALFLPPCRSLLC